MVIFFNVRMAVVNEVHKASTTHYVFNISAWLAEISIAATGVLST